MTNDRLNFGTDPNFLMLKVEGIQIEPVAELRTGDLRAGVIVKMNKYNLENLLCQLLEEYGEEKITGLIKSL